MLGQVALFGRKNGDLQHTGKLVTEHKGEPNVSSLPIWSTLEDIERTSMSFDFAIHFKLFLHLKEFFCGEGVVAIAAGVMESLDYGVGFIVSVLLEKPAWRKWKPRREA